ncbi:1-phosphatidylinositol phosphodiesterase [Ceratocystis platani]|uniref:1-phosphatidylinositol phosphodiesterase n=1 Tax=Ceratocystis fimbriata f. sp. platani TaxID=88771 RepID=A0A0F8AX97_CERFI|nr:1-phosphatidylinositol phosphodiesterase [Ceratocystis platani]
MRLSLLTTLACLALCQTAECKDYDDFWSFDVDASTNADWMSNIADDTPLTSLVIPGTHNSVTDKLTNSLVRTQNKPLIAQLNGGIRYVDITCQYETYNIRAYHGIFDTGYTLTNVLNAIFDFLDDHRREAVILRIQKGGMLDAKKFKTYMDKHFSTGTVFGDAAVKYIYSSEDDATTIPTVGQLRGKVFVLQDFKSSPPGHYGLPWNPDTVSNYNNKLSVGTFFQDSKWDGIKSHLSEAPSEDSNKFHITYTTASAGVSPINYAARKNPDSGMNKLLGLYLLNNEGPCFGIIAMDFPGQNLVKQILKLNEKYLSLEPYDESEDEADATTVDGASRDVVGGDDINPSAT